MTKISNRIKYTHQTPDGKCTARHLGKIHDGSNYQNIWACKFDGNETETLVWLDDKMKDSSNRELIPIPEENETHLIFDINDLSVIKMNKKKLKKGESITIHAAFDSIITLEVRGNQASEGVK